MARRSSFVHSLLAVLLIVVLLLLPISVFASGGICNRIEIIRTRYGTESKILLYEDGTWYGEGSDNKVVYVDSGTSFKVILWRSGGGPTWIFRLIGPGWDSGDQESTGSFRYFSPTGSPLGTYFGRVDTDTWKRFDIVVDPNHAPYQPSSPTPSDGATDISVYTDLSWSGGDPDGDSVTYDVYFEKNDSSPNQLVSNDQSGTSYDPGTLDYNSHYYWQIEAKDEHGATRSGPVWDFTTSSPEPGDVSVATYPATSVGETQATLRGAITDFNNNPSVQIRFRYRVQGTTTWSYTGWVTRTTTATYSEPVTGLSPDTTYEFQAEGRGSVDTTILRGDTLTFHTSPTPPGDVSVATYSETGVGETQATLRGAITDFNNNPSAEIRFRYRVQGTTTWSYTGWVTRTTTATYSETVTGLSPDTTYEFQAEGRGSVDTTIVRGDILTFNTSPPEPGDVSVATYSETGVGETQATLRGAITDFNNNPSAEIRFRYRVQGTTTWSYTGWVTRTTTAIYSETVTGLSPDTTYEFQAEGRGSVDTTIVRGVILTFTTELPSPDSITITGWVRFRTDDDPPTSYDAKYVEVKVYDAASSPEDPINITYTGEDGTFSIDEDSYGNPITPEESPGNPREIYVQILAQNEAAFVEPPLSPFTYNGVVGPETAGDGGVVHFGTITFPAEENGSAFSFLGPAREARQWVQSNFGYTCPQTQIVYPSGGTPHWSNDVFESIIWPMDEDYVPYEDETRSVFFHEYGHGIHDRVHPGYGCPGSAASSGFYSETDEGTALSEGWAIFFQEAVLHQPGDDPSTGYWYWDYTSGGVAWVEEVSDITGKNANMVPGAIASILWDLYDVKNDDGVQADAAEIWDILENHHPVRMWSPKKNGDNDFYHYWVDAYGWSQEVDDIFIAHGIPVTGSIVFTTTCPVDMVVTDPDGLTVTKSLSEVPGAVYTEVDLNGDGDPDDRVIIPEKKPGDYQVIVIAEGNADPSDIYNLEVSADEETIVLADNVQIGDIPDEGYTVRSTETGIAQPMPFCFIATAAYGTPMAEEIQILREFRDEYLLTNSLGQAFVDFYYKVSPPIAEFITEHPNLKTIVRVGLVPAVAVSTIAVNTPPTQKVAILGFLVLVSAAVVIWVTRRRGRSPEYTDGDIAH